MRRIPLELTTRAAKELDRSAEMHGSTAEILLKELLEEFAVMPAEMQDAILAGHKDAVKQVVEQRANVIRRGRGRTRRTGMKSLK